jgi:hypothetical protein
MAAVPLCGPDPSRHCAAENAMAQNANDPEGGILPGRRGTWEVWKFNNQVVPADFFGVISPIVSFVSSARFVLWRDRVAGYPANPLK